MWTFLVTSLQIKRTRGNRALACLGCLDDFQASKRAARNLVNHADKGKPQRTVRRLW